ncbi:MAG: helix-turn-helix transcriptional regulator [Vulcanimicrobiota bacterium]
MPVKVNGDQFFRLGEVAEAVGVCRQTLWRWRQDGKIPEGRRYREKQLLYTHEELEAVREFANRMEPASVARGGGES